MTPDAGLPLRPDSLAALFLAALPDRVRKHPPPDHAERPGKPSANGTTRIILDAHDDRSRHASAIHKPGSTP